MNDNVSNWVANLPPEARKAQLPYAVTWMLLGAQSIPDYKDHKGIHALILEDETIELSEKDYQLVDEVATEIYKQFPCSHIISPQQVMRWHRVAHKKLSKKLDTSSDKSIVMLSDTGGCAYWRMVLPAKYLQLTSGATSKETSKETSKGSIQVDVTSAGVQYEHLLEYDTIFVQRLYEWPSYYTMEKVKRAGKRIVYDIDDDIFNITQDNPASRIIGRDEQHAAVACMKLADTVTTTTPVLEGRLRQVLGEDKDIRVIPNALDPSDGWSPVGMEATDGWRRIFWQGSSTHAVDWEQCIEAVDEVFQKHDDVRLTLLGFLPPVVQARLEVPHWKNRVEFLSFRDVETYFELVKHIRAAVGIAPLAPTTFNTAKSNIKFLEYSLIGMPTVASDIQPYNDVIDGEENGLLASTTEEWVAHIEFLLGSKSIRDAMTAEARKTVYAGYDIREVVGQWEKVLLP